jgi:hypothetical protein
MPGSPLSQDLVMVRTSLEGGGVGPHPRDPVILPWESRAVIGGPGCAYRGPVLLCGGPVQMVHPGMYHLFSPHGASCAVHVVGLGAVHRAARGCRTSTASLYCSRGYP